MKRLTVVLFVLVCPFPALLAAVAETQEERSMEFIGVEMEMAAIEEKIAAIRKGLAAELFFEQYAEWRAMSRSELRRRINDRMRERDRAMLSEEQMDYVIKMYAAEMDLDAGGDRRREPGRGYWASCPVPDLVLACPAGSP